MHKRKLHHQLVRLRRLPTAAFIAATILFAIVSVFALRANNQQMIKLRDAVFVADERGEDVEGALRELREFVYAHMNTNLAAGDNAIRPPIQLKYTYERLTAAEQAKQQTGSTDLYTEAQAHCEATVPGGFSGSNRLPCIREYLDAHGANTAAAVTIPEDLYKFDFTSPAWSPDLAGWSLVLTVLSAVLLAARVTVDYLIRSQLRR